uniref:(northern house mosquito) hypothetical protein n=1 Tax=Culex pipiens TaxID=7175 RepID=A0A8D8A679_CULPI
MTSTRPRSLGQPRVDRSAFPAAPRPSVSTLHPFWLAESSRFAEFLQLICIRQLVLFRILDPGILVLQLPDLCELSLSFCSRFPSNGLVIATLPSTDCGAGHRCAGARPYF